MRWATQDSARPPARLQVLSSVIKAEIIFGAVRPEWEGRVRLGIFEWMEETVGELPISARQWSGVYHTDSTGDATGEVGCWKMWAWAADYYMPVSQSVRNTHTHTHIIPCCHVVQALRFVSLRGHLSLSCPPSQQHVACLPTVNRLTGPSVDG